MNLDLLGDVDKRHQSAVPRHAEKSGKAVQDLEIVVADFDDVLFGIDAAAEQRLAPRRRIVVDIGRNHKFRIDWFADIDAAVQPQHFFRFAVDAEIPAFVVEKDQRIAEMVEHILFHSPYHLEVALLNVRADKAEKNGNSEKAQRNSRNHGLYRAFVDSRKLGPKYGYKQAMRHKEKKRVGDDDGDDDSDW